MGTKAKGKKAISKKGIGEWGKAQRFPMNNDSAIYGYFIKKISSAESSLGTTLMLLRETDHLLLRFGEMMLIRKDPSAECMMILREAADEIWFLVDGSVEFIWHDLRQDSPTFDQVHKLMCDEPTLVLAPFGVAFGCHALENPASLIRIATYDEGSHPGDRSFAWEAKA
jgi:dTDP-4-dehydrorhamnose 3,5-epimerase